MGQVMDRAFPLFFLSLGWRNVDSLPLVDFFFQVTSILGVFPLFFPPFSGMEEPAGPLLFFPIAPLVLLHFMGRFFSPPARSPPGPRACAVNLFFPRQIAPFPPLPPPEDRFVLKTFYSTSATGQPGFPLRTSPSPFLFPPLFFFSPLGRSLKGRDGGRRRSGPFPKRPSFPPPFRGGPCTWTPADVPPEGARGFSFFPPAVTDFSVRRPPLSPPGFLPPE